MTTEDRNKAMPTAVEPSSSVGAPTNIADAGAAGSRERGATESTVQISTSQSSFHEGAVELPEMSARSLALRLLRMCLCSACHRPVHEPITLPCGHSSCLACIVRKTTGENVLTAAAGPANTLHRPPRLPLASTTVPCPSSGCSRSAIGRGLGSWTGRKAVYGSSKFDESEIVRSAEGSRREDDAPNLPLDGFVVPTNQNSSGLTVIPAQRRSSFSRKYAISKYGAQGKSIEDESALLCTDVTLAKTVDILRRFAEVSPHWPTSSVQDRMTSSTDVRHSPRRHRFVGRSRRRAAHEPLNVVTQDHRAHTLHPLGSRTEINERFLGVMGASEDGIDAGTVGGVLAVPYDDDSEDSGPSDGDDVDKASHDDLRLMRGFGSNARTEGDQGNDEDDDEIGGAFARQQSPTEHREKRMRRRTIERSSVSVIADNVLSADMLARSSANASMTMEEAIALSVLEDNEDIAATVLSRQTGLDDLHTEMLDVLECQLCYMLLFQPLTTPCGHTFCRRCFARSLDHSSTCPLCRADMPPFSFFQEHPSNLVMVKLLTAQLLSPTHRSDDHADVGKTREKYTNLWGLAQLHEERKIAIEKDERESLLSTPLFVCTLGFPQMPTILHIFEPRYRLMIRRCIESGHPRFGMVLHSQDMSSSTPGMSPYGTMLEIRSCQMLPDGRSMIETKGSYRFRVLETGSLDGYTVGHIDRVDDVPIEAERELAQASTGNFRLWESNGSSLASHSTRASGSPDQSTILREGQQRRSSSDSTGSLSSSTSPAPSVHLTAAEALEAHTAFQAALGLDSFTRNARATPAAIVSPSFVERTSVELVETCTEFIETLRSGSAPWLMTRLNDTYGPMPDIADAVTFGYWMALVMPIDEHEKAKLLPIRSAHLRLCIVVHWIEQLRQTWWFNHGCSIQ